MTKRLTEKKLQRFYRLLSTPMTNFDCGKLCAPKNNGVPACCDTFDVCPVLYREEYDWHSDKSEFWQPLPLNNKRLRELAKELDNYSLMAKCPGHEKCRRTHRALVCRTFPFEPYLDKRGKVLGLVFNHDMDDTCPLIGKPRSFFNEKYITNSIKVWSEIIELIPQERECFMEASDKLRKKFKRRGKRVPYFKMKQA